MDNQDLQGTYDQTKYPKQKEPVIDKWVVSGEEEANFTIELIKDYKPTILLLQSIIQARQDRDAGKASPVFNSVAEMKKWFEKQNE